MPTKINFVGSSIAECIAGRTFSCTKIGAREARERELETLDENRRAVGMLNPMRVKKNMNARTGG